MSVAKNNSDKLREAVIEGNVERFMKLVANSKGSIQNYDPNNGWSSLHYAARYNQTAMAMLLLDMGHEDSAISRDIIFNTPLIIACQYGSLEVVQILLKRSPQSIHLTNKDQWTCLHSCARHSRAEVMMMLVESKCNVNALDKEGCTPLHYAAAFGFLRGVEILIESGADYHIQNKQGWTARDYAYSYKHDSHISETVRRFTEGKHPKKPTAFRTPTDSST